MMTFAQIEESRMYQFHKHFRMKWAPNDPRERDDFEAELARLLSETHIMAVKPFHEAAARQLACTPLAPVIMPKT